MVYISLSAATVSSLCPVLVVIIFIIWIKWKILPQDTEVFTLQLLNERATTTASFSTPQVFFAMQNFLASLIFSQ